jgi:tetratricopeptide (TPR) repeat protein
MLSLGRQLMYKRKYQDAVEVFQLGLESNPVSSATYDSLGRAYRLLGKNELALKYSEKSRKVLENPEAFSK